MADRYITPVGARGHMDKVAERLGIHVDPVPASWNDKYTRQYTNNDEGPAAQKGDGA